MNIKYEKVRNNYTSNIAFNKTKSNILILGKADTYNERCNIINPMGLYNARELYGEKSELYLSYKDAINITNDNNVFTVNCRTYQDYLNVAETALHYNFDYFVPTELKFEDTFYNQSAKQVQYYVNYFMYLIEECSCVTTIIMTNHHSKNYDTIDSYLRYAKQQLNSYYNMALRDSEISALLERNASDIVYVPNNLIDCNYANVVLAAQLANKNFNSYPKDQSFKTFYDIENRDLNEYDMPFHKYNYLTGKCSIDNLVNMRLTSDVYKNILIDSVIKSTIKNLGLDEYKGKIYNAYVKLQIENKVKKIMDDLIGVYFKNYQLINVGFVKTEQTSGYIYIELSIMPYGYMDYINMVMEV